MNAGREVYLVAARRTPIGMERGALAGIDAAALAAVAIRAARPAAAQGQVDRVVIANVGGHGNIARHAALAAGLPADVLAVTVNAQCTGGMTAARMALESVRAGGAEVVVAGGAESVSQSRVWLGPGGKRRGETGAELPRVSHAPPPYADPEMGAAADALAAKLGIGREEQDMSAGLSGRRAMAAKAAGHWREIIAPVETEVGCVAEDELPRRAPSPELLARLRPAFVEGGTVTAGNTAPLGDGAAALLFASGEAVQRWGMKPIARVVAAAGAACDPAEPPLAAVAAAEAALAEAGITAGDIGR
ncbi:MAG: hypothetical protein IT200_04760, partial [Thermoleophilia bacterium]|nr:hypothetical protein [Thermoleophilia bacterium]